MKDWLACALLVSLLLAASDALAFHPVSSFGRSANDGGGNRTYFTGSPRFRGYDCAMCHVGSAGRMRMEVESDPPELIESGIYKPWQVYELTVKMVGEHLGIGEDSNENMFVAEYVDANAKPVGDYDETELGTLQRVGGQVNVEGVVVSSPGKTSWTFNYTAPGPGTGAIALHLAAVDGDAGATHPEPRPPTDPLGDDVFVAKWEACEQWTSCDETEPDVTRTEVDSPFAHGCAMTPSKQRGPLGGLLLAAIAVIGVRQTRRRP